MSVLIQQLLSQWLHLSKLQVGVNETTGNVKNKRRGSDHTAFSSIELFAFSSIAPFALSEIVSQ